MLRNESICKNDNNARDIKIYRLCCAKFFETLVTLQQDTTIMIILLMVSIANTIGFY